MPKTIQAMATGTCQALLLFADCWDAFPFVADSGKISPEPTLAKYSLLLCQSKEATK